jgi:hypothetical protein
MTEQNGKPQEHESVGNVMAADMLRNLVVLNERLKDGQALHVELKDSVDQLIGHFEVFGRAMELICDQKEEGKVKFSLGDFADAYLEAADEIMPADDESGPEDPLVDVSR